MPSNSAWCTVGRMAPTLIPPIADRGKRMAVTILFADDHHVVRQGLRMLLEAQRNFRVIAEVGDGLEAVKITERFTAIAVALFVSPRTVETHRAHLMRKLDLHTQADLIRYALRRGILPLEL